MLNPTTIREVAKLEMTLWAVCLYCGHARLKDPNALSGRGDALDAVALHMNCHRCNRGLIKLVPTPRTMVTFDRHMGGFGN